MGSADRLVQRWYDSGPRPWLLRPLTWLYRGVTALRVWMYRHGWLASVRLPVPVLVVGNITVGGTGKTPLVIALVDALRERGWHPGVVSRGYGGSRSEPTLLPEAPEPAQFGDEPCLIHARTGVPVAVGRDRPVAARLLLAQGVDLVIADDGLQHYRLQRDVEICVIDGNRGLGNGLMLPCGPLREPRSRLRTVDFRIGNGGDAGLADVVIMRLQGGQAVSLTDASQSMPLETFCDQPVHALAGIGNPSRFFDSLRAHGLQVHEHAFPDHHAYTPEDLAFDDNLPLLMTDKDAVKCRAFAYAACWSVPVSAALPAMVLDKVHDRIEQARAEQPCREDH